METQKLEKLLTSTVPAAAEGAAPVEPAAGVFVLESDSSARVCAYLLRASEYVGDIDEVNRMLSVAFNLYRRDSKWTNALRVALRINDKERVAGLFAECTDDDARKQMAFVMGQKRGECISFVPLRPLEILFYFHSMLYYYSIIMQPSRARWTKMRRIMMSWSKSLGTQS